MHISLKNSFILICFLLNNNSFAQDKRAQYPAFLRNSYLNVNIGYINYPFSNLQVEPGYQSTSVEIPHLALRLILLGHHFTKNISAQISYMRPFLWVRYNTTYPNFNNMPVFMNVGGLTVKGHVPVSKKISVYGEGGLGIVTRSGVQSGDTVLVKPANFSTFQVGGGLQYHLSKKFDLTANVTYSPSDKTTRQPHTLFLSAGMQFNILPLSDEKVKISSNSKYIFPKNMIQAGYVTNKLGYGVNKFLSEGPIPVFWGGQAEVEKGFNVQYTRNVFHTKKIFSLDVGVGAGYYVSRVKKDKFFTLSVFPVTRFTPLHTRSVDFYFFYAVPGPTFISKVIIDDVPTGKKFTFRDQVGIGTFSGSKRNINAEIRIGHYSNGNLFVENEGVKVPLTFNIGYTF